MKNLVVGSLVLMLVTLGWSERSVGEQVPAPRGELRIVDSSSFNFVTVVFNVFEHLLDLEEGGKPVPRLATGWHWVDDRTLEMTLRQGVKFHNGEVFDAEIVKLNVEENLRLRQPYGTGDYWNFQPGSRLEITVSDQGIGIAPDFLPRIFERFQQADISTTRRTGGMGIGLSVAKYIVEAHGGEITASSAGLGRGAVFTVRLPVPSMLEAAVAMPAGALPSLADVKVLVVDDDLDSLAVMRRALEQAGAEAHIAENARDALKLVKARAPDLLVSDIGMPTEDGYALVRKVRELDPPLGAIPAMALTAFARPEDHQRALAHIGKPVDAEELIRAVAALVAGRAT